MKYVIMCAILGVLGFLAWFFLMRGSKPAAAAGGGGGGGGKRPHRSTGAREEDAELHWLVGVVGEVKGKQFQIGARNITIGRGTNCFVQLKDAESSRVHCQIRHTPKGLQITDMSSANGTIINGDPVQLHILNDGDRIQVGDTQLVYRREGDFAQDAGIAGKAVGKTQFAATAYSEDMSLDFKATALEALKASDGNVELAAKQLKVDVATFRKIIEG